VVPQPFAPFPGDTDYFGDTGDLDAMIAQLAAAGIPARVDPESYPNGQSD
jgi:hypothetical protein